MKMIKKNKLIQYAIIFIITIVLLYLLIKQIDIYDLINLIKQINYNWITISFVIYVLIYLIRSYRFQILFKNKINLIDLFFISCLHNFYNSVLPARLGELSYPYFVKKFYNQSFSISLSHLFLVRILDLIGVGFIFLVSLLLYVGSIYQKTGIFIVLLALILLAIFIFSLPSLILLWIKKINTKNVYIQKVSHKIILILENLKNINHEERNKILLSSLLLNFLMFLFGYTTLHGININLSMIRIFIGGALALLSTLLPINTFFNIGVMEAGWTFAFVLVGLDYNTALLSGSAYHLINIVFTSILFILGVIFYFKKINQKHEQ